MKSKQQAWENGYPLAGEVERLCAADYATQRDGDLRFDEQGGCEWNSSKMQIAPMFHSNMGFSLKCAH